LRLAACVPLKQFVQLLQEYGVFFSTRNRPPPVLRTRSLAVLATKLIHGFSG